MSMCRKRRDADVEACLRTLGTQAAAGVAVAPESDGKLLLAALGIAVPNGRVVRGVEAAADAAAALGTPVVIKSAVEGMPHKSDFGLVRGPLRSRRDILDAARSIVARGGAKLLVEEWCAPGVECFVGLTTAAAYGPIISFGLGGVWVEVMGDVTHRLAPVNIDEAHRMVNGIRGAALLAGARNAPRIDRDALAQAICRISFLATSPTASTVIRELDVNPLLARDGVPVALDCTLVLSSAEPTRRAA